MQRNDNKAQLELELEDPHLLCSYDVWRDEVRLDSFWWLFISSSLFIWLLAPDVVTHNDTQICPTGPLCDNASVDDADGDADDADSDEDDNDDSSEWCWWCRWIYENHTDSSLKQVAW